MNIHELDIFKLVELKNIVKEFRDISGNKIRDTGVRDFENEYLPPRISDYYDLFKKHNDNLSKIEKIINYKLLNEITYE